MDAEHRKRKTYRNFLKSRDGKFKAALNATMCTYTTSYTDKKYFAPQLEYKLCMAELNVSWDGFMSADITGDRHTPLGQEG